MNKKSKVTLPGYKLRQIAVAADVHPETLRHYLQDKPGKPVVQARMEEALRGQGYDRLIQSGDLAVSSLPKNKA